MTTVRIYQPSKTAMQSGKGKTKDWVVEFETRDPLIAEPLIGWVQSFDTHQQLHLSFQSLDEALQYAKSKGFSYTIYNPSQVTITPKSYATNFTCSRVRGD
jgi:ETC complex I subunit conserved region